MNSSMRPLVLCFGLAASLLRVSSAQPGAPVPAFEVATIRPGAPRPDGTAPPCAGGPGTSDPSTFRCPCKPLGFFIQFAFNVTPAGLDGPPSMDDTCYDIAAKVPLGSTRGQLRQMLQNLLAERFHLTVHRETRSVGTYALVVAQGGPRLKPSTVQPALPGPSEPASGRKRPSGPLWAVSVTNGGYYRLTALSMDLKSFVIAVEAVLRSPVVDETGLAGNYEFTLDYRPTDAPAGLEFSDEHGFPVPDFASALQLQLGLKLNRQKLSHDVVVIDHLDKSPTAN